MNMEDWERDHEQRMTKVHDRRQQNRLVQHAKWLVLFGHLRRHWPKNDSHE